MCQKRKTKVEKLIEYLEKYPAGKSTLEISIATHDCAVHSTVYDANRIARNKGLPDYIGCHYRGLSETGNRIFIYCLTCAYTSV